MRRSAAALGLTAFLGCLAVPGNRAAAYTFNESEEGHRLAWKRMPVDYLLVSDNVPEGPDGEAAVRRAFRTWSRASDDVGFQFAGYGDTAERKLDGQNLVYWVHSDWDLDPRLAAVTFHYYDDGNGRLLDADIIFNGEGFTWSVGGVDYDIENSAAHEVGHFTGLGHSSDSEATMYSRTSAGETRKRTLEPDDVDGMNALYGGGRRSADAGLSSAGASGGGGGCAIATAPRSSGDATGLVWLAILWAVAACRARRPH